MNRIIQLFNPKDKYKRYAIYVILIGAVIRLLLPFFTSVAGDACWHLSVARVIAENYRIPLFFSNLGDSVFWTPPLFHVLAAFFYKAFGLFGSLTLAKFSMKFISPLASIVSLVYAYKIINKLFKSRIAFFSIVFITFLPVHIYFSSIPYIESLLSMLIFISIYYALENKIILSALFSGLTFLTKYNGVLIFPIIIFILLINNKNKIGAGYNILKYSLLTFLIGGGWYIRNWIYLGNPVWNFFNDIFQGYGFGTELIKRHADFAYLLDFSYLKFFYLSLFGVSFDPAQVLKPFLDHFLIKIFIIFWLLATIIYITPLIIGLAKIKLKNRGFLILLIWFLAFSFLNVLYIIDTGDLFARLFLPAIPVFGVAWAFGIVKINKFFINPKIRKILIAVFLIIILGFVSGEFVKAKFASSNWNQYNDDFNWIRDNIPKNKDILALTSQCLVYYLDRGIIPFKNQTLQDIKSNKLSIDYVLIDKLKTRKFSREYPRDFLKFVNNTGRKEYINDKTETVVYKLINKGFEVQKI